MLDLTLIRRDSARIRQGLLKRGIRVDFGALLDLDDRRRTIIRDQEKLRTRRKAAAAHFHRATPQAVRKSEIAEEARSISSRLRMLELELRSIESGIRSLIDDLPNLPDDDVLPGGKANNRTIRQWGHRREYSPDMRDHVELAESLQLIDYKRGAKLGGSGTWVYSGHGALIEWALINFFVEHHLENGYQFILPPHLLTMDCGYVAGQFPKFSDDVYQLIDDEGKPSGFLLPTAETALANLHRDETLTMEDLPRRYFAYSPCYRVEIGSYRRGERGTIRGHQFNKVEMFQITEPHRSEQALLDMLESAEKLMQALGLHYRVSELAAGDLSFAMAKTLDIEVWIPSLGDYKEVSSISNARDFQARRGNIRYRHRDTGKRRYVHTLNGSGLATSRIFPALLEQLQLADGKVEIPDVLAKRVGRTQLSV